MPVISCCRPLAAPALSADEAEATAQLFKALGDPARVKIVNLLATSEQRGVWAYYSIDPAATERLRALADLKGERR